MADNPNRGASANKGRLCAFPPVRTWREGRNGVLIFGRWRPAWEKPELNQITELWAAERRVCGVHTWSAPRRALDAAEGQQQLARLRKLERYRHALATLQASDDQTASLKGQAEVLLSMLFNYARRSETDRPAMGVASAEARLESICRHIEELRLQPLATKGAAFDGQAGADAKRELANFEHEELDREIQASIARRENPRLHVKRWIEEYKVSQPTVYRRIEKGEGKKS